MYKCKNVSKKLLEEDVQKTLKEILLLCVSIFVYFPEILLDVYLFIGL